MKPISCRVLLSIFALPCMVMLGACAGTSAEAPSEAYVASEHRIGTNLRGRSSEGLKHMSQEELDTLKSRAAVTGKGPSN